MKKKTRVLYRISSLLLMLLMLVGVFATAPFTAGAATTTKVEKSYEIAVVFDNSGSMYLPDNTGDTKAWSRAKYAMEIFASMLDYGKDSLTVFPMWEVTTDGSTPAASAGKQESTKPIEITKQADIDKLTKMYTIFASGTPFTPVEKAYDHLIKSQKDEKWLIVLTDGAFDNVSTVDQLQDVLFKKASNGVKVQYLGFGGAPALNANVSKGFYAPDASALEAKLIEACNTIFQRSVLPANRLNGKELNLDLSMKKLIVFVQGEGATIKSLSDSASKQIGITLDSKQRKFSDVKYSAGNYVGKCDTDQTLYGQVVTFEACAKGKYTLDYTGAQNAVQIFYEPDVDIEVTFTNSDGEVVDNPDEFFAGEYTVNAKIVDSATKEDVTNHELMGNDVKLVTKVKTSKDSGYKEYPNGSKITFAPDDGTEVLIEGEYLGKYKISSADDPDWSWLRSLSIPEPQPKFQIDANVMQNSNWYIIKDCDKWQPIRVAMTLDGQPLTDEQLAKVKLSITTSGDLKYRCELIQGESAYNVYVAQDENGKYVEPETGKYKLNATATYIDEYGEEATAKDDVSFEIQWYSKFWRWLLWILIILVIIIIIMMILNHPTLPSSVYLNIRRACHTVKINGTSIGLSTDLYPGEIRCEAKACTPLKDRGKPTAAFEVKDIRPIGSVNWYEIDGSRFRKTNGRYVNDDGETISQVKPKIRVSDDTELKWNTNRHTVTGRIYINHND